MVFANKINFEKLSSLWDLVDLTSKEELVIKALNIIDENILRISFSNKESHKNVRAKLRNSNIPIPLSNMDGWMRRI